MALKKYLGEKHFNFMSHRVHPKIFRIKEISDWLSRGFYKEKPAKYLEEDFKIREFLEKKLKECSVATIEIERFSNRINVIINTGRPGLVIGRGGAGAEEIKKSLEKVISLKDQKAKVPEIRVDIRGVREVWSNPDLVIEWIAQRIEKRMPFRKVLKQAISKIMLVKGVEGARIEIAGRLGGAEIARREWLKKGNLPRQTIRADIIYGSGTANCSYGAIGIKVWIYKGEKF